MDPDAQRRRIRPLWLLVIIVIAFVAAAGGYVFGRSTGEDLDRARTDGRAIGERIGSASGAERGYRAGLGDGRRQAYRAAYRAALRRTLRRGKLELDTTPVRRSCGDLAEQGAGSYNVQSVNVICDIALQVGRQWAAECAQTAGGDCTVRAGFACDYQEVGYERGEINCTDGSRRVTFETGA